jgi:hypothetical protein
MACFDISGLFYFMAAAAILLAVLAAARSWSRPEPVHLERPFEILTPQAASLAHEASTFRIRNWLAPTEEDDRDEATDRRRNSLASAFGLQGECDASATRASDPTPRQPDPA